MGGGHSALGKGQRGLCPALPSWSPASIPQREAQGRMPELAAASRVSQAPAQTWAAVQLGPTGLSEAGRSPG